MALCAGYIAAGSKWDFSALTRLVERFEPASSMKEQRSEHQIIETPHGHHVAASYCNAVNRPFVCQDEAGNSLILLGFVQVRSGCSLLQSAVSEGPASLEKLEGQFVAIFYHAPSGVVHIVNDRFGSRPFYILKSNRNTYYSSSLSFVFRLADVRPEPDPVGWLQIFAYGHTLGRR